MNGAGCLDALDRLLEAASAREEERLRARLQRSLEGALRRMHSRFAAGLRATRLRHMEGEGWTGWQGAYARAEKASRPALTAALSAGIRAALEAGRARLAAEYLPGPGRVRPLKEGAASWISGRLRAYLPGLVSGILETTRAAVATLFGTMIAAGSSIREVIAAVARRFTEFWRGRDGATPRTEMIARAEVGSAVHQGELEAAREAAATGIELEKQWITMQDDRVEQECLDNEAAGFIAIDEQFPGGVLCPLQHPRCRCRLGYRIRPQQAAA